MRLFLQCRYCHFETPTKPICIGFWICRGLSRLYLGAGGGDLADRGSGERRDAGRRGHGVHPRDEVLARNNAIAVASDGRAASGEEDLLPLRGRDEDLALVGEADDRA